MLSGTGRHRRPRHAPAFLVTAGVTGAGIALPLLGTASGSAHAVSDETWDAAAECESGGMWSANDGGGYYGGLQLTMELWVDYGGQEFAARPDLASRAHQITVAERILADQGPDGFPGCALLSGLWQEYREEQVQGDGGAQEPEAGADGDSGASAAPEADADGDADAGADAEVGADGDTGAGADTDADAEAEPEAESQPETAPEAETDPESAPEAGPDAEGQNQPSGSGGGEPDADGSAPPAEEAGEAAPSEPQADARPGPGRHRGEPDPAEAAAGAPGEAYAVEPGDSLSAIAAEFGVPGGWPALYQENKAVIGDDPDHIYPDQQLDLTVTAR